MNLSEHSMMRMLNTLVQTHGDTYPKTISLELCVRNADLRAKKYKGQDASLICS